ncbi:uncharacterized protein A4U43_C07F36140 [Asparagus officinalis]|uniref:Protein kinase domain-containing protein n=1 Tax=Asparagus officinalis TaxID=4686 RepID=A0A5P1EHW9_ASPOF|nr:uncharacterized protein LOC109851016 [Asparagus officinalis]ONK65343.1 uncharacterized protein A4U43_C07F36140 [Asparagus officinalis]
MADSVDVVLEFLRKNRFTKAEAALKGELGSWPNFDESFDKYLSKERKEVREETRPATNSNQQDIGTRRSNDISQEFIVKDIEGGRSRNRSENKKEFGLNQGSLSNLADLYPWNPSPINSASNYVSKDSDNVANNFSELMISEQAKSRPGQLMLNKMKSVGSKPEILSEQSSTYGESNEKSDSNDCAMENPWSKREELSKECSVKTLFPLSSNNASTSYDLTSYNRGNRMESNKKADHNEISEATKEQPDDMGMPYISGAVEESLNQKNCRSFDMSLISGNHREDLPRLPPVRLKSIDKLVNMDWEAKGDTHGSGMKQSSADNALLIGSFLDVPIGQDINSSGGKRTVGSSWLSVSRGIAEDTSDLVSGFATLGDGLADYPNEYWDSDEYDDDDDVGYMRQPIEDETWFLAHEIDYPSDNEKGTAHGSVPEQQDQVPRKDEDDDQSFAEEESYLSGEQYFPGKNIHQVAASNENDLIARYDGQLLDAEELNLMRSEPVWQGLVNQSNELSMIRNGKVGNDCERPQHDDLVIEDDQHGSVRSVGVGINSDTADFGSERRESLVGGSSEGDIEYIHEHGVGISGSRDFEHDITLNNFNISKRDKKKTKQLPDKYPLAPDKNNGLPSTNYIDAGFSFPPPRNKGGKSEASVADVNDDCKKVTSAEDMLATWRRQGSGHSPIRSSRDEKFSDTIRSRSTSASSDSNYAYAEREGFKRDQVGELNDVIETDAGATLEDEEAAALQEQVRQIKAQEEEFETFNLKIVHRKNRTGFEEDKNFHVVLNSVIAGRYHVTEYLGSAAFSKAIQAHDLHTGMDVCVKIIKNNKDFFDQSLDEIKLLKFVNKHDPADKYHLLRLYDYFYYREHLLIVCELLKANLYEFHKFNRESGGEVYFTMPRLQSITIQCLEALEYLHRLGLIHCDLKPENILVKSYSRCEVKVIDLGSSCFQTDHLCSYVQSRSYRAPEVILGLPYDKKIDIWSLGCILAELCTGNVLFQNDSPATLLARVIGIIGPIDQAMLAKGRDTYKYFTKNHMLYERNQETNRLEYLIPKKSSLRHRLPMGDQGFIDFVAHLLEVNPKKRPSASEALKHPWLSYPYEPISS